jgi:hypothetical protein
MTTRTGRFSALAAVAVFSAVPAFRQAFGAEVLVAPGKPSAEPKWESLFDGKTLKGWKAPQFGGEGKVEVKDGAIFLLRGDSMTGVTYTGSVPTVDYELTFEGKRVDGVDFFCTTTFPVGKSHCSFVVGGWGGPVVGLSSVDYYDAADNETTRTKDFKLNQWYRIRIRVSAEKIECWIDDEKMVDLQYVRWETEDGKKVKHERKISIRFECDLCRPLGISTWSTTGAVRDIRIRRLTDLPAKQPSAAHGTSKEK